MRNEILVIWIIALIGFGNLILIIGVHLLDSLFEDGQLGFTFFGIEIYKNTMIDSLYVLIFILQIILMYFMLEDRIKRVVGRYHAKK